MILLAVSEMLLQKKFSYKMRIIKDQWKSDTQREI